MQPTTRSFNALMSACERGDQPDRALEVFRKIKRAQQLPTAVTYNTLLSALGKAGRCASVAAAHAACQDQQQSVYSLATPMVRPFMQIRRRNEMLARDAAGRAAGGCLHSDSIADDL